MYYSKSEILDELSRLTRDDLTRLKYTAVRFLYGELAHSNADDVVQEAIERVLRGSWNISKDRPFIISMMGVVRSIASTFNKIGSRHKKIQHEAESRLKHDSYLGEHFTDNDSESEQSEDERIDRIKIAIESDEECATLLELRLKGFKKRQILETMKLSNTQYETISRRFKRKVYRLNKG